MSEVAAATPGPEGPRSFAGASPAQLRAALTPEAAGEFDRQWRAVMARTTESLDLTELFQVLAGWRQVAQLTAQLGHDGYRDFEARTLNRVATRRAEGTDAEVRTGVEEIDTLIQARLAQARSPPCCR
ncbi:MAG TPA: DUF6247 family protein [Kineosporiaceae bacterium]|jgi:hypothetical protein|nr:DUF6247 family protein [Kineosporiaceae bacterium]